MAKKINLNKGKAALVDDSDYQRLIKIRWWVRKGGNTFYAVSKTKNENGKWVMVFMHRIIMGVSNPKEVIDHKDWNGLNNQRSNLRVCTHAENLANRNPACKSRGMNRLALLAAGVRLKRPNNAKPWSARVLVKGKYKPVGDFETQLEASIAYHQAVKEYRQLLRIKKLTKINANNQLTNEKPTGQVGFM